MEKDATLHYGLGCDSSWLIWDYLTNPKSKFRKYNISKVLISQTGLESKLVQEQVEQIIFPLLREHQIRTIQIARKSSTLRDGFTILDDTDSPEICYIRPTTEKPYYTLEDEMLLSATVPQYSKGKRYCSDKFKIKILDSWHDKSCPGCFKIIGFDRGEGSRIEKAKKTNQQPLHPTVYPLYEEDCWRDFIEVALEKETGKKFVRSACTICPFGFIAGTAEEIKFKFDCNPYEGARAAYLEYVSICFNPKQSLNTSGRSIIQRGLLNEEAKYLFELELEEAIWKIYRVKRVKGLSLPYRSINAIAIGTRQQMLDKLREITTDTSGEMKYCDHGIGRYFLPVIGENCEEFLVVTPGSPMNEKKRQGFDRVWNERNEVFGRQLALFA